MKNSLQMIGISIILWFGLGIGQASATTAPAAGTNSSPSSLSIATESSPTDTASLQAPGPNNKFAGRAADAGKDSLVSEHQTVAMLLVGLGLLGFSARHRRDVV
jgi:hypothetical protein